MRNTSIYRTVHVSQESATGSRSSTLSYLSSTRRHRVSLGHIKIFCCIFISIMMGATFGAIPFTNIEGQRLNDVPTNRTHFAGWEESIDRFQKFSVPVTFVRDHLTKHPHSYISNCPGKTMIGCHAADIQIFNANLIEVPHQVGSEFMQSVGSTVGDMLVQLRNFDSLSLPPSTAFLAPRKNALQSCQLGEITAEMPWVCDAFSVGQSCETIDTKIDPNSLPGFRQFLDCFVEAEGDKVMPGRFLGYRNRSGHTFEVSAPMDIEATEAGKDKVFIVCVPFESADRVFRGLPVSFLFERRIASSFGPEIEESSLKMAETLLNRDTGCFSQPFCFHLFFQNSELGGSVVITDSFLLSSPGLGTDVQCPVVYVTAAAEDFGEFQSLGIGGIESESISCLHTNIVHCVRLKVN